VQLTLDSKYPEGRVGCMVYAMLTGNTPLLRELAQEYGKTPPRDRDAYVHVPDMRDGSDADNEIDGVIDALALLGATPEQREYMKRHTRTSAADYQPVVLVLKEKEK
jgi:hypothetical protein